MTTTLPYRDHAAAIQPAPREEPNMWMQLLEDASSDKRLPEKQLLVLGGSIESQNQFLDSITPKPLPQKVRRPYEKPLRQKPRVANRFALGYTYQDVLDFDQEDILARMSIYLLSDARPYCIPIVRPLFTSQTIPDSLAVILLDWDEPWNWLHQVRERIVLLRASLDNLDNESRDTADSVMTSWRERRIGPAIEGSTSAPPTYTTSSAQQPPPPPLGPGEWDEPLGVPITIICQNAEQTHILAREHGWTDVHFDFILQHLRTIALKHGASLLYTSSSDSGELATDLVRSSLSIHSLIKKTVLKPEAIARDKILIPPNWDTWGKIRTLDAEFDVEGVSKAWSDELEEAVRSLDTTTNTAAQIDATTTTTTTTTTADTATSTTLLTLPPSKLTTSYTQKIRDPTFRFQPASTTTSAELRPRPDFQAFLRSQLPLLRKLEAEDEEERRAEEEARAAQNPAGVASDMVGRVPGRSVEDIIGPISVNVGGVNVDVEAALKGMRERAERDKVESQAQAGMKSKVELAGSGTGLKEDEDKKRLEWFAGLANRRRSGGGSSASTPQR